MLLKRVELWWRTRWIRLLVSMMRRPADARPDWDSGPRRVLFLRHDRAGDMIVSTGVMRAIARSHPTIALDVLASPRNADLVRHTDYLADVIVFDKRKLSGYLGTLMRLRRARYDVVIDCMVTAPSVTTLLLMLASGARHRLGIADRGNDAAFNLLVPAEREGDPHMVDRLARLAIPFGPVLTAEQRQPTLTLTEDELARAASIWNTPPAAPRVLVNISAGGPERLWPDERYVAVMRHFRRLAPDADIRVISSPDEVERAERIARDAAGTAVRTPRIREAIALIATADFVFTPDTSIAHAASALQKPAVAIYGKGSMNRWALYGGFGQSVEHTRELGDLGIERVVRAIDEVWEARAVSRRG